MAKKAATDRKWPGRPAVIRGRGTVVSLILTPEAHAKIERASEGKSEGDVFEALVLKNAKRVKMPKPSDVDGWKPKSFGGRVQRFEGRTMRKNVRLSDEAIALIDVVANDTKAVRSDVAEALIRQFV